MECAVVSRRYVFVTSKSACDASRDDVQRKRNSVGRAQSFFSWLCEVSPDVLDLDTYAYVDAQKKGYSGVAIHAKRPPDRIVRGLGMSDLDAEGRYLRFDWGDLSIASLYVPSGTSGAVRRDVKGGFLERFFVSLATMRAGRRRHIIFREVDLEPKRDTRWSNGPAAFENKFGWRIDFQLVTPNLAGLARDASIYAGERFSDHAPLTIDYDMDFVRS